MVKVNVVKIHHDYETSNRAGAGGMFQIITAVAVLDNETEVDLKVDCGRHYSDNDKAMVDIRDDNSEFDFSEAIVENDD